jgi:predicted GNAT family N-acyltransferase
MNTATEDLNSEWNLMDGAIRVLAREPRECDEKLIADFTTLVMAGGEVAAQNLGYRIRSAARLIFLTEERCLAGIAALKLPLTSYRKQISTKSGFPLPPTEYPFELGWVLVVPSARGRKFSLELTRAALAAAGNSGVFATSRTGNEHMHTTLTRCGFSRAGQTYPSTRGGHQLQLFVRKAMEKTGGA